MRRIKLILAMTAILVGILALQAGPAIADDDCDFRERGNRDDVVVCHDDGDREVFKVGDYDDDYFDRYYYDDDDYFDRYDNDNFYFLSPYNYYGGFDNDYYHHGCEGPVCLID